VSGYAVWRPGNDRARWAADGADLVRIWAPGDRVELLDLSLAQSHNPVPALEAAVVAGGPLADDLRIILAEEMLRRGAG
jgi:hypothetical protein